MPDRKLERSFGKIVDDRINSLSGYLSDNGLKSYDPYDGLSSPLARGLVKGQLASRVWLQAIRYFPINLRPVLGIHKIIHAKLLSDLASGQSLLFRHTGNDKWSQVAEQTLKQLYQLAVATPNGLGWGLNFPYATRFVSAGASDPNIFQTINAIQAFIDGAVCLDRLEHLDKAYQGFGFLLQDLGYVEQTTGISWKYWNGMETPIYNVNGLMAGLTARLWKVTGDEAYRVLSTRTMEFLFTGQRNDGSWPYAADARANFTDGFHTGYIIEGLSQAVEYGAMEVNENFKRGIEYYIKNFFSPEHLPKYYPDCIYPIDAQNAAQAIQTLVGLSRLKLVPVGKAEECFLAVDDALWSGKDYYHFWKTRFWKYRTPMHRWATGPMFLALARLKTALDGRAADRNI